MWMYCSSDFSWSNPTALSNGSLITTLPSESQTSGCGQLNDGRQSGSVSTSASLPEVWKSSHTCCVFSQGSCPWVMLQFLYLPPPATIGNCLGIQYLFVFEIIWNQLGCHEASLIMILWMSCVFCSIYSMTNLLWYSAHCLCTRKRVWKMFSYLEMCTKTQASFFLNWPTIMKITCDFILHRQSILKITYRVIKLKFQKINCVPPLCTTWDQALHMCKPTTSKSNPRQNH